MSGSVGCYEEIELIGCGICFLEMTLLVVGIKKVLGP